VVEHAAADHVVAFGVDGGEREQPAALGERREVSIDATSASRSNAGRFPASRTSGSVNAGRIASTSSSEGRRRMRSRSRIPSDGTERRKVGSGILG
jgi:hypothetical protein